jgi:hypothetical protein
MITMCVLLFSSVYATVPEWKRCADNVVPARAAEAYKACAKVDGDEGYMCQPYKVSPTRLVIVVTRLQGH